jgi:pimeloyl-ACP methyl ester carboxylesterase
MVLQACSIYDVWVVCLFAPLFVVRIIHFIIDRVLAPDSEAVFAVDSFINELRYVLHTNACKLYRQNISPVEIRKGRRIQVLHIPAKNFSSARGRVLLVHGACARMQQLVFIIRDLMDKGYEIVSYDALGCRMSDKPLQASAYGSHEMFADMVAVIKHFSSKNMKWTSLIGHSIGGAMLAKFATAKECTNLTASVVLIAPPVIDPSSASNTSIFKLPVSILWLIRPWMGVKARSILFGPKATGALKNMEREASARNPVYMFKAFYSSIDRSYLQISESLLLVPALFIGAEYDKICPAAAIEDMSKRLG